MPKRSSSSEKGFTLIEMLVVVALVVLIAGIALPRFLGVTQKARISEAMGEVKLVQAAVESFMIFNNAGIPPGDNNRLREVSFDDVRLPLEGANPRVIGNLLAEYEDPFESGHRYKYKRNEKFDIIFSAGPNGTYHEPVIDAKTGAITELQSDDIFVTNANSVSFL